MALVIRPIELRDANLWISTHHRHHKRVQGHRFSISCWDVAKYAPFGEVLCGVAVVGRPVARLTPASTTLEVTRLCTDGTKNACSFLYSAAARVGRELGYSRIQTFILETESGASLVAAGWVDEGVAGGGQWKHTDGKARRTDQPTCPKRRYARSLK